MPMDAGSLARGCCRVFLTRTRQLATQQNILGLIDFGGQIISASSIRVQPLHEAAMGADDIFAAGIAREA